MQKEKNAVDLRLSAMNETSPPPLESIAQLYQTKT